MAIRPSTATRLRPASIAHAVKGINHGRNPFGVIRMTALNFELAQPQRWCDISRNEAASGWVHLDARVILRIAATALRLMV
jgi:hypothetical protein